jgi:MFS family permease
MQKVKLLFDEKRFKLTVLTWILWTLLCFVFYGTTFILPIIVSATQLQNNTSSTTEVKDTSFWDNPFVKIISPIFAEIPASIICAYLVDHPSLGRKNTLTISLVLAGFAYLMCLYVSQFSFVSFLILARFFMVLGYNIKYTYTSELYHTNIRSTAVGLASAFGRLGGIIMPLVLITAKESLLTLPFLILGVVCFITAIDVYLFPYDTTGRQLDID